MQIKKSKLDILSKKGRVKQHYGVRKIDLILKIQEK